MSKIPEVPKSKYNKKDPFSWVDYQWEKFMTEQKELKAKIEKLEQKVKKYKLLYKTTRKDLKDLVKRTPSKFLSKQSDYSKPNWTPKQIEYWDKMIKESIKNTMKTNERSDEWRIEQFNRNRAPEDQVSTIEEMEERVKQLFDKKYIYESPDAGKTITRRKFGDYDNKETLNN